MYARVTRCTVSPDETDPPRVVFASLVPTIRELEGYEGSLVLANDENTEVVIVTLWRTGEDMGASDVMAEGFRRAETAARGFEAGPTERFFVVSADFANPS